MSNKPLDEIIAEVMAEMVTPDQPDLPNGSYLSLEGTKRYFSNLKSRYFSAAGRVKRMAEKEQDEDRKIYLLSNALSMYINAGAFANARGILVKIPKSSRDLDAYQEISVDLSRGQPGFPELCKFLDYYLRNIIHCEALSGVIGCNQQIEQLRSVEKRSFLDNFFGEYRFLLSGCCPDPAHFFEGMICATGAAEVIAYKPLSVPGERPK
ncbi:MAG: hypothetical protein EPN88_07775 [Bacteroidetes bacterium]|nr:MAG: hypothetical protein EPN88_07775 [Bacteroidota bacterium]